MNEKEADYSNLILKAVGHIGFSPLPLTKGPGDKVVTQPLFTPTTIRDKLLKQVEYSIFAMYNTGNI